MIDTREHQTLTQVKEPIDLKDFISSTEEAFIARDRRTCDCELTYVHRKRHGALGRGIEIRLCCLAKKVEELAGLPKGILFSVFEFEPSWVWDCESMHRTRRTLPDGSKVESYVKLGNPPKWLSRRMKQKGIEIKNLKEE